MGMSVMDSPSLMVADVRSREMPVTWTVFSPGLSSPPRIILFRSAGRHRGKNGNGRKESEQSSNMVLYGHLSY